MGRGRPRIKCCRCERVQRPFWITHRTLSGEDMVSGPWCAECFTAILPTITRNLRHRFSS